jgi:hypothetical protein
VPRNKHYRNRFPASEPYIAKVQWTLDISWPSGTKARDLIAFDHIMHDIAISIAQNIFSNTLVKDFPKHLLGIDPQTVVNAGATNLGLVVPANMLEGALRAYSKALTTAFIPTPCGGED